MEAVGAVSVVLGIVDISVKVIRATQAYVQSAKRAPQATEQLTRELSAVFRLGEELLNLEKQGVQLSRDVVKICESCQMTLESMLTTIQDKSKSSGQAKLINFRQRLKWPFKEQKILEWIAELERYKSTFSLELQMQSIAATLKTRRQEQRRKLIEWLAPLRYNTQHEKTSSLRQQNTCNWIFELDEYKEWENGDNNALWIHGIPGSGKSVLVSNIIDHLRQQATANRRAGDYALTYCYCDFTDHAATEPPNIIRTLLVQALQPNHWECTSSSVEEFQDLLDMINRGQAPPRNIQYLLQLFERACTAALGASITRAVVVIDALDECSNRPDLLAFITRLAENEKISILVTSRHEQDMIEKLERFSQISMASQQTNSLADMELYLSEELKTAKWDHVRGSIREEIIETLLKDSEDNMFRWLQCQLDALSKNKTNKQLREALGKLPPDLFRAYERILLAVDKESQELALGALTWLVTTTRPMLLTELVEALAILEGERDLDLDLTVSEGRDLVKICGSLVEHNKVSGTIQLSHATVKDFLLSNYLRQHPVLTQYAVSLEQANAKLAKLTLSYLMLHDFASGACKTEVEYNARISKRPLYNYCVETYHVYVNSAMEDDDVFELLFNLFFHELPQYESYHQAQVLIRAAGYDWERLVKDWDKHGEPSPLRNCIEYKMLWPARRILLRFPELREKEAPLCKTPLCSATYADDLEFIKMLLGLGVDVNKPSESFNQYTPLFTNVACGYGSIETFHLLLEHGADVNMRNSCGRHLIHGAAEVSPAQLDYLLTTCAIDANLRSDTGCTPLHYAVANSHRLGVERLIQAGADIFAMDYVGETPIHGALSLRFYPVLDYFMTQCDDFSPLAGCPLLDAMDLEWARGAAWYPKLHAGLASYSAPSEGLKNISNTEILRLYAGLMKRFDVSRDITVKILDYAGLWMKKTVRRDDFICVDEKTPRAPYLSLRIMKPVRRIVYRMRSHDQGWSGEPEWHGTYRASNTWFESDILCSCDGKQPPTTRLLQRNVHACDTSRTHQVVLDSHNPSADVRKWVKAIHVGDVLATYGMARYPGWTNYIEWVELEVYFTAGEIRKII